MEGSNRTTTLIVHLALQQKTSEKCKTKQKKIQPYDRKFPFKQYIKLL